MGTETGKILTKAARALSESGLHTLIETARANVAAVDTSVRAGVQLPSLPEPTTTSPDNGLIPPRALRIERACENFMVGEKRLTGIAQDLMNVPAIADKLEKYGREQKAVLLGMLVLVTSRDKTITNDRDMNLILSTLTKIIRGDDFAKLKTLVTAGLEQKTGTAPAHQPTEP